MKKFWQIYTCCVSRVGRISLRIRGPKWCDTKQHGWRSQLEHPHSETEWKYMKMPNPAPVDRWWITFFTGVSTSQVMHHVFDQQYERLRFGSQQCPSPEEMIPYNYIDGSKYQKIPDTHFWSLSPPPLHCFWPQLCGPLRPTICVHPGSVSLEPIFVLYFGVKQPSKTRSFPIKNKGQSFGF